MLPLFYLTVLFVLIVLSGMLINNTLLFGWLWFNLFIAIYEFYIVYHKNKFSQEKCPLDYWKEHVDNDFWLKSWHEYSCQSDTRYLDKTNYVFNIELTNAIIIVLLWIAYLMNYKQLLIILLILQAVVCIFYFITLFTQSQYINKENKNKLISYLFISSWWIIVPVYIVMNSYSS